MSPPILSVHARAGVRCSLAIAVSISFALTATGCSKSTPASSGSAAPSAATGKAAPGPTPAPVPGTAGPTGATASPPDPETARTLIAAGATVIDVRTPDEYAAGHVANATNIPVDTFATRIAEVDALVGGDKTKPVVVYCAAGKRAAKAKAALDAAGYTGVVNGRGYDDLH